ncbi:MAG: hypothetical protein OHK0056_00430 [Bacteriovoracaceae bacterium]
MAEVLNYKDVQKMDKKAIDGKVDALRREMFNLKMQKATTGLEKPHQLKTLKKNIARLLTAANAK